VRPVGRTARLVVLLDAGIDAAAVAVAAREVETVAEDDTRDRASLPTWTSRSKRSLHCFSMSAQNSFSSSGFISRSRVWMNCFTDAERSPHAAAVAATAVVTAAILRKRRRETSVVT